tara:strand:+ start:337 stop:486 length:150 start_codon:yes stop_codon:yes gene_type:complete
MGDDYFKTYYQQNKDKIKGQSKKNYDKKRGKSSTIPIEVKFGTFLISFD